MYENNGLRTQKVGMVEDEEAVPPSLIPRQNLGAVPQASNDGANNILVLHRHAGDVEADVHERGLVHELSDLGIRAGALFSGTGFHDVARARAIGSHLNGKGDAANLGDLF